MSIDLVVRVDGVEVVRCQGAGAVVPTELGYVSHRADDDGRALVVDVDSVKAAIHGEPRLPDDGSHLMLVDGYQRRLVDLALSGAGAAALSGLIAEGGAL